MIENFGLAARMFQTLSESMIEPLSKAVLLAQCACLIFTSNIKLSSCTAVTHFMRYSKCMHSEGMRWVGLNLVYTIRGCVFSSLKHQVSCVSSRLVLANFSAALRSCTLVSDSCILLQPRLLASSHFILAYLIRCAFDLLFSVEFSHTCAVMTALNLLI